MGFQNDEKILKNYYEDFYNLFKFQNYDHCMFRPVGRGDENVEVHF